MYVEAHFVADDGDNWIINIPVETLLSMLTSRRPYYRRNVSYIVAAVQYEEPSPGTTVAYVEMHRIDVATDHKELGS